MQDAILEIYLNHCHCIGINSLGQDCMVVKCSFVKEISEQHKREPVMVAVRSEIKAPMYIDLQNVRKADGMSCFEAISSSSSC